MSERSEELRRQRDALLEQLARIERELGAEEARRLPPSGIEPPPQGRHPEPADDRDAEAILAEYREPTGSIASNTKLGCVLYFILAMGLLALAVAAFYLFSRASRPH